MTRMALAALLMLSAGIDGAALAADGDASRGARVFQRCYSCHSVDPAERELQGPNLYGVIGRRAGSLPDFEYSPAMIAAGRDKGLVWTEQTLDAFLADPAGFMPETLMPPLGLNAATDRADVIAYLKRASE